MNTDITWITLSCDDSWFFKESRPIESPGGYEAQSQFPPSVRTVVGALRSYLGTLAEVDWQSRKDDDYDHQLEGINLKGAMGDQDSLGSLQIKGPYLYVKEDVDAKESKGHVLFPVPAYLMRKMSPKADDLSQQEEELFRLNVGKAVISDLGNVCLPELPENKQGAKPTEGVWGSRAGFETLLNDEKIMSKTKAQFVDISAFLKPEPRKGVALDADSSSVKKGMLYQTCHLRVDNQLKILLGITGLPEALKTKFLSSLDHQHQWRFGAEGRTASVGVLSEGVKYPSAKPEAKALGVTLQLTTDMKNDTEILPGFVSSRIEFNGDLVDCWEGVINEIKLRIICVVAAKCKRIGGWDLANKKPRAVESLVPAGTSYFCLVEGQDIGKAVKALNDIHVGADTQWGYGHIACGIWKK